jgi:signal transduction histidine kinase
MSLRIEDIDVPLSAVLTRSALLGVPAAVAFVAVAPFGVVLAATAGLSLFFATSLTSEIVRRRRREQRELEPMQAMFVELENMRLGATGRSVPSKGSVAMRMLIDRFNRARTTADTMHQQSHARAITAESAFARVNSVFESFVESVIVIDDDDNLAMLNGSGRKALGEGAEPGVPLATLLPGELGEDVFDAIDRVRTTGMPVELHDRAHRNRWFEVRVLRTRPRTLDTRPWTVIVLEDVTREHEVAKLKDAFLSSVSHELRTPLTGIFTSAEILAELPVEDEGDRRMFLDTIIESSTRLGSIVDDIMLHVDVLTGNVALKVAPTPVAEIARKAIESHERRAAEHSVTVECTIDPDLRTMVDASKFQDVARRLVGNALEFTPEGGRVRVRAFAVGEHVVFDVDDSGPGVPPDLRRSIFNHFEQKGDGITDKPRGMGLGLSICSQVLQLMGGTIECLESEELGGSRFRVRCPAVGAGAEAEVGEGQPAVGASNGAGRAD